MRVSQMARSTYSPVPDLSIAALAADLLGERGEITCPLEMEIYDKLVIVLMRKLRTQAHLEWVALEEANQPTVILIDDGRGELYYALQPIPHGTGWEMIDMRHACARLLSAPTRIALALLAIGNAAMLTPVAMVIN